MLSKLKKYKNNTISGIICKTKKSCIITIVIRDNATSAIKGNSCRLSPWNGIVGSTPSNTYIGAAFFAILSAPSGIMA
jgi:hypothetical protein